MAYCAVTIRRSGPNTVWGLPTLHPLPLPTFAHGAITP